VSYNKISRYKTFVRAPDADGSGCVVKYHNTEIVRTDTVRNRLKVTLDHNGWKGVTTKRKMNQAANEFLLGFGVHQADHVWYVRTIAGVYEFERRQFAFDAVTGLPWDVVELFTEKAA